MEQSLFDELMDRPIAYHRIFARFTGCVATGVFLSQAFYWSRRTSDPNGWFYKTQTEWMEETVLTRRQQEKARKTLKDKGVIDEKLEGIPARLYFRLNKAKLMGEIDAFLASKSVQTEDSKDLPQFVQNVQSSLYKNAMPDCTNPPTFHAETTIQRLQTETTCFSIVADSDREGAASAQVFDKLDCESEQTSGETARLENTPPCASGDVRIIAPPVSAFCAESPAIEFLPSVASEKAPPSASVQPAPVSAKPGRQKKSTSTAKTGDPRAQHPAIQAVRSLINRYPDRILWDDLIAKIGDAPDIETLTAHRKAQLTKGINPQSLIFVDWAIEKGQTSESRNEGFGSFWDLVPGGKPSREAVFAKRRAELAAGRR